MGHRLSKIYTRTGDRGETGLAGGSRVDKASPVMEAVGDLDELNSRLGLLLSHELPDEVRAVLEPVQHQLFNIGAEVSGSTYFRLDAGATLELESALDRHNESLPPLKEFVLPGGAPAAAACHQARTVCRRAERRLVAWAAGTLEVNPEPLKYINRLSDLLFVLARVLNRCAGHDEVLWRNPQRSDSNG